MNFVSTHTEELPEIAKALIPLLAQTPICVFKGEMGAGKTTFIKALCKEMGIQEDVSSPTFSLVNEYRTDAGQPVFHFDFYRIKDESEAHEMGIYEYFDTGICFIEWGEKIPDILKNEPHLLVRIHVEDDKRFITFEGLNRIS